MFQAAVLSEGARTGALVQNPQCFLAAVAQLGGGRRRI